ncbi:MAG: hypothetical protein CMJ46_14250 [Planctomyces sp.]|nr:hypothetical protein [Planctomyces sp.]
MPVLNRLIRKSFSRLPAFSSFVCVTVALLTLSPIVEQFTSSGKSVFAQEDGVEESELSEEEQRQELILKRYQMILEGNPAKGTAFDRLYSMYVEQGKLDQFVNAYQDKVKENPDDGAAWKILGMIQAQRGEEGKAIDAYEKAEALLTEDASVSYYLGQTYLLTGLTQPAIAAFERAVEREPAPNELLDVYQSLGKVYQRNQQPEKALEVWERLDEKFPNSQRVQEQIAITLVEEAAYEEALKRYQQMEKETTDDYRRVNYGMKVAEMQLKLGKREDALAQFESLMSNLNPTSWLYRQVRDNIEGTFLKNDDEAGLTAYYKKWLESNPRDVDAMARMSDVLFQQDREDESEELLRKAIELAPSDTDLRNRLITQLIQTRDNDAAIKEYEKLNEIEPDNPETLRDWGLLIVLDRKREKEERQAAAAKVWKQLLDERGDDPVIVSQVADWFREAEMEDEAIELYQKAIALAPDNAQYREYLGEYYHRLERKEEALATWKELIAGDNHTTRNLIRLAEVLRGFGYSEEGLAYMKEACENDVEYADRINYARMLIEEEDVDAALDQLDKAIPLAENDEERHNILRERIQVFQVAETLGDKIRELEQELTDQANQSADKWARLALFHEANGAIDSAYGSIREALAFEEVNLSTLSTAGRIAETVGDLAGAIAIQKRMLEMDRKARPDYLRALSQLELQMGHPDEAVEYADQLISTSPGSVDGYLFYSNLCFDLGREEEGFKSLRKAVRLNPNDQDTLFSLAAALAKHYRTDDAIQLYWNAFDKADDLDSQLQVAGQLSSLYQRTGKFEELIERLKSKQREREGQRELNMVIAYVYRSANNFQQARQVLEEMLEAEAPDPMILEELISVAESENEPESALKYMEQLAELAPSERNQNRLLQMKMKSGEIDQVDWVVSQIMAGDPGADELMKMLESLVQRQQFSAAREVNRKAISRYPDDWELKLIEILLLLEADDSATAREKMKAFAELDLPDLDYSSGQEKHIEQMKQRYAQSGNAGEYRDHTSYSRLSFASRQRNFFDQLAQQWKQSRNPAPRSAMIYTGISQTFGHSHSPLSQQFGCYGNMRMAAIAELYYNARPEEREGIIKKWDEKWSKEPNDFQAIWNRLCLRALNEKPEEIFNFAAQYIDRPEYEFATVCTSQISAISPIEMNETRILATDASGKIEFGSLNGKPKPEPLKPVLTDEQLDVFLKAVDNLQTRSPGSSSYMEQQVIMQLLRHGRQDEAQQRYEKMYASASTPQDIYALISMEVRNQNYDKAFKLVDRYMENLEKSDGNSEWLRFFPNISRMLPQLQYALSSEHREEDLIHLFETALNMYASGSSTSPPPQIHMHGQSSNPFGQMNVSYHIQVMVQINNMTHQEIRYPMPTSLLNTEAIQTFYNFYFHARSNPERQAIFQAKIEERAADAPEEQQAFYHMLASAFHWWNNQPEAAAVELAASIESQSEASFEMRQQLIKLYASQNQYEAALEELDRIEPDNLRELQSRESAALEFAMQVGREQRAREAAERLFTMRLGFNEQMELANRLKSLGMNEMAAATLKRSRQSAGNDTNSLYQLMQRYESEDKEVAAEIAMQILQHAPQPTGRNSNIEYYHREAARVLNSVNRLGPLIEETEAKLEASPKSVEIMERLVVYLDAANQRNRVLELQEKILELKPMTAEELARRAGSLSDSGQYAKSIELFEKLLDQDTEVAGNYFYKLGRAYSETGQLKQLVDKLETLDLSKLQMYHFSNLFQHFRDNNPNQNNPHVDQAIRLFELCWKHYEHDRLSLVSNVAGSLGSNSDELWQDRRMKKYLQEVFLPPPKEDRSRAASDIQRISFQFFGSEGKVTTLYSMLLDSFDSKEEMSEFREKIAPGVEEQERWSLGRLLLTMLDIKLAKEKLTYESVLEMLRQHHPEIPEQGELALAYVCEDYPRFENAAIAIYEQVIASRQQPNGSSFQFRPESRLLQLYLKHGEREKGVNLLVEELNRPIENNSNADYQASREIRQLSDIAEQFRELNLHFEAWLLNQRILLDTVKLERAKRYLGSTFASRLSDQQAELLKLIDADQVRETLKSDYVNKVAGSGSQQFPVPAAQILDTRLADSESMEITNPFLDQLRGLLHPADVPEKENSAAREMSPEQQQEQVAAAKKLITVFDQHLQERAAESPEDAVWSLAILTLHTLDEEFTADPAQVERINTFLNEVVLPKPVTAEKEQGEEEKPTATELSTVEQVTLFEEQRLNLLFSSWLIARELWRQEEEASQKLGDQLSESVLNGVRGDSALSGVRASRRVNWLMGLLRDRGREYLRRGNKAAAAKDWRELLELLLKQEDEIHLTGVEGTGVNSSSGFKGNITLYLNNNSTLTASQVKALTRKTTSNPIAPPTEVETDEPKPISFRRLQKVLSLASMVAEEGMPELSLEAVSRALEHGIPPYAGEATLYAGSPGWSGREQLGRMSESMLFTELLALEELWRKNDVPLERIFDLYAEIVFPESDPQELRVCELVPMRISNTSEVVNRNYNPLKVDSAFSLQPEGQHEEHGHAPVKATSPAAQNVKPDFVVTNLVQEMMLLALEANQPEKFTELLRTHAEVEQIEMPIQSALLELALVREEFDKVEDQLATVAGLFDEKHAPEQIARLCSVLAILIEADRMFEQVLPVYEAAIGNVDNQYSPEPASSALVVLGLHHAQETEIPELLATFDKLIGHQPQAGQNQYIKPTTQVYPQSYQVDPKVAVLYETILKHTDIDTSVECLRRYYDACNGQLQGLEGQLTRLYYKLKQLPAAERYELLHGFVFPEESPGRQIRQYAEYMPADFPPGRFMKSEDESETGGVTINRNLSNVFDTTLLLWNTAEEIGKQDELLEELKLKKPVQNELSVLQYLLEVQAESKNKSQRLKMLTAEAEQMLIGQRQSLTPDMMAIGEDAMNDPELREEASNLIDVFSRSSRIRSYSYREKIIRSNAFQWQLQRQSLPGYQQSTATALPNWVTTTQYHFWPKLEGAFDAAWFGQSEYIKHENSSGDSLLLFKYPIQGDFVFSMESLNDRWSEGHITYGGLTYQLEMPSRGEIWGMGRQGSAIIAYDSLAVGEFNEFKLKVTPDNVRMFMNDVEFSSEDNPPESSPWIGLFSEDAVRSYFRNFKLEGDITIPDEVALVGEQGLRGWVGSWLKEGVENVVPLYKPQNASDQYVPGGTAASESTPSEIWVNQKGVLLGRKTDGNLSHPTTQSYLYYYRPLLDKDVVRCEFYYERGQVEAHPTLGRLAFLLAPEGVQLHWIIREDEPHWSGLTLDNRVALKEDEQLVEQIPLKEGEWNQLQLEYRDGSVHLTLNDTPIVKFVNEQADIPHFGLFHFKDQTELRVRNVELTGDWPESLTAREIVAMMNTFGNRAVPLKSTDETVTPVASLVPEEIVYDSVDMVLEKGRLLDPESAYEYLRNWVLPNQEHHTFRLYPSTVVVGETAEAAAGEPAPIQYLDAPVFDLLERAKMTGKLDELINEAKSLAMETPNQKISQTGFLILAELASGHTEAVDQLLPQFREELKLVTEPQFFWNQWSGLVVYNALKEEGAYAASLEPLREAIDAPGGPTGHSDFVSMRNPQPWRSARDYLFNDVAPAKEKMEKEVVPRP